MQILAKLGVGRVRVFPDEYRERRLYLRFLARLWYFEAGISQLVTIRHRKRDFSLASGPQMGVVVKKTERGDHEL